MTCLKINSRSGFSLIELIVAVGVFSIVATITTSTLLILTKAERKAVNVQISHDNLRYALETMAKEIRTGSDYALCNPPDKNCFKFVKKDTDPPTVIKYKLSDVLGECGETSGSVACITKAVENESGFIFHPVTAPEIDVYKLDFYLSGGAAGNETQPRVTIVVRAETPGGISPLSSVLDIQTTVSQL